MRRPAILLCLAVLALSRPAWAQAPPSDTAIDVTKLGVSIDRIRRELSDASEETRLDSGLKLSFRIEVFGQAPPLDIIGDFDVVSGPVPGSAPSHREVIEFLTPEEFRAPAASFSNLFVWAAQKLSERSRKSACEEEIARYRAQVLSGISVSAPTCAR
jgi:hypothetical protein